MDSNKYRYCFIDSSYLIRRNGWACSRNKKPGEYGPLDIVRMSIQTINKMARDYGVTADKYILVFDAWSKEYQGYYRSYMIKDFGAYKGTRTFPSVQGLKDLQARPGVTQEELEKYASELYENQARIEAKKIMKELGRIGIPSIWSESFEFDDLVYMASVIMIGEDKPSVIVTKDSDLQYCTSPVLDYFALPAGGSDPRFITYTEMWNSVPDELKPLLDSSEYKNEFGSPLYFYKALLDSLGEGHNDLEKTKKPRHNANKAIYRILKDQDYQDLDKPEIFLKQLETFKVFKYPKAMNAYQEICSIQKKGHYSDISEFRNFCNTYGLTDISDSYYQGFLDRLDQKLFSE